MTRRQPIYFVLDVSESMAGKPLENVHEVIGAVIAKLRTEPQALETVWLQEIVFAARAKALSPLTELYNFNPSKLPIGSGTGIGAALTFLMSSLRSASFEQKSRGVKDWKPVVYFMTDGRSTDDTTAAVKDWQANFKNKSIFVSIAIGKDVDVNLLRQLSDDVMEFDSTSPNAYLEFAKWVSQSVTVSIDASWGIDRNLGHDEKTKTVADAIEGVIQPAVEKPRNSHTPDPNIYIVGRCAANRRPYLASFDSNVARNRQVRNTDVFKIDESYFDLSIGSFQHGNSISVTDLEDPGQCLYCNSTLSLIHCGNCSKISCGSDGATVTCPWCEQEGTIIMTSEVLSTERGLG
jgi:uncharacterized protein YegL